MKFLSILIVVLFVVGCGPCGMKGSPAWDQCQEEASEAAYKARLEANKSTDEEVIECLELYRPAVRLRIYEQYRSYRSVPMERLQEKTPDLKQCTVVTSWKQVLMIIKSYDDTWWGL